MHQAARLLDASSHTSKFSTSCSCRAEKLPHGENKPDRTQSCKLISNFLPPQLIFFFFKQSNCVEVREIILIYTRVNVYAGTSDKRSLQVFISNFGKLELIVQQDSGGDRLVTPSVLCLVHRSAATERDLS